MRLNGISLIALAFLTGCNAPESPPKNIEIVEAGSRAFLVDHRSDSVSVLAGGSFKEIPFDTEHFYAPFDPKLLAFEYSDYISASLTLKSYGDRTFYNLKLEDHSRSGKLDKQIQNAKITLSFEDPEGFQLATRSLELKDALPDYFSNTELTEWVVKDSFPAPLIPYEVVSEDIEIKISHNLKP